MQDATQAPDRGELKAGHHWKEADRVAEYIAQNDEQPAEMPEVLSLLTAILPYDADAPLRILDVGSGHGIVAAAVLDAFPKSKAVGLDISEPMMEVGRQRMARFGDRFRYHPGDFSNGTFPADLAGPFDVVVSSRAIHHLTPEGKQRLFATIYQHTAEGGCFLDVDNMRPNDDFLKTRYRVASDPAHTAAVARSRPVGQGTGGGREHQDPVGDQLTWLREAGFEHVDCFWKRLGRALIGGFK
jgi:tRNA (cmo5U34)-methyltransferase